MLSHFRFLSILFFHLSQTPVFFLTRQNKFLRYCNQIFWKKNFFDLIDQKSNENERILIIEAKINEDNFIVINIYNSSTEFEQLKTFSILQNMLGDIEISNKQIAFLGDFYLICDCKLETNNGNLVLKKSL